MLTLTPHELKSLLDELGLVGSPQDDGQPRPARLRAAAAPLGLLRGALRRRGRGARKLERRRPDIITTAAWWKEERGERIFVDYNQNAPLENRVRRLVGSGPHRTVRSRRRCAGRSSTRSNPNELTLATRSRNGSSATATRGRRSTTRRSRWSRCWRCTSATARTACETRRGRRSTRRARRAPAGRAQPRAEVALRQTRRARGGGEARAAWCAGSAGWPRGGSARCAGGAWRRPLR